MKSNRGETWSAEEIKCLIDIWSDEHIQKQLSTTHKNSCIYALFSKQLREKGYPRTVEQCRIKTKKLRAKYIEVRDALSKTGISGKEKDKLPWYDALDGILGTKPIVEPVDVVENDSSTLSPLESIDAVSDLTDQRDTDVDGKQPIFSLTLFWFV
uniref:Myb/SANT-like DNA-binding domain-containing protein n=1 Tax=Paramormyrops kingsleyae TaxID=1676925 RepID=A0A3B3R4G7_9TELE